MSFWTFLTNLFKKKEGASVNTGAKSHMLYSVLTGLNHYQMPGNDLNGCVEDANDLGSCLKNDFKFNECKYLLNSEATKENIIKTLSDVLNKAVSGDTVVYYHSGHGTKTPDLDNDEKDGYDECFVNYDFSFNDRKKQLIDDDFAQVLKLAKEGVNLIVIVDTCHSGTISREFGSKTKKKFIQFPHHALFSTFKGSKVFKKDIFKNQPYLLLSACADAQTSEEVEMNGKVRGVFTYFLVQILKENKDKTWKEIFSLVCKKVKENGFDQTPQFNGDGFANKKPFSGE